METRDGQPNLQTSEKETRCCYTRVNRINSRQHTSQNYYTVTSRNAGEVTIQSSKGVQYQRNVAHLKKYIRSSQDPGETVIDMKLERGLQYSQSTAPPDISQPVIQPAAHPSEGDPTTTVKHSDRVRVRPSYLQNFVTFVHGAE